MVARREPRARGKFPYAREKGKGGIRSERGAHPEQAKRVEGEHAQARGI